MYQLHKVHLRFLHLVNGYLTNTDTPFVNASLSYYAKMKIYKQNPETQLSSLGLRNGLLLKKKALIRSLFTF